MTLLLARHNQWTVETPAGILRLEPRQPSTDSAAKQVFTPEQSLQGVQVEIIHSDRGPASYVLKPVRIMSQDTEIELRKIFSSRDTLRLKGLLSNHEVTLDCLNSKGQSLALVSSVTC